MQGTKLTHCGTIPSISGIADKLRTKVTKLECEVLALKRKLTAVEKNLVSVESDLTKRIHAIESALNSDSHC